MDDAIATAFKRFLEAPSPENFTDVREALLNSPSYGPDDDRSRVYAFLSEERYEEAHACLMAMMPNQLLSPGVHTLAGLALQKLGKNPAFEYQLSTLLTNSILATGDGSEAHPYSVLHAKDETDIIIRLEKRLARQQLRIYGNRYYDLMACEDGSQVWFDVTDLMQMNRDPSFLAYPMKAWDMEDSIATALAAYLKTPSSENFMYLRETVERSLHYRPYGKGTLAIAALIDEEQYEEAYEKMRPMIPNYLLSPHMHRLAGFALQKLGQNGEAGYEFQLAMLFTKSILSSGHGTQERPYLVLHVSDEYSVLPSLQTKQMVRQSLRGDGDKHYDVLEFEDGNDVWFDVTSPMRRLKSSQAS